MKIISAMRAWWKKIMSKIGKGNPFPADVPTITLAATTVSILEGQTLSVVVNRPASAYTSTCRVYTIAGTAGELDYTAQNGVILTFAPADVTKTVTIPILNDALAEGDETFTVQIANPTNAVIGNNKLLVTITGQAAPPATVSTVSSPTVTEGGTLVFAVALSGASLGQSFPFTITGTAASGADYTVPFAFSNGVTISGTNLIVPAGVPNFTASATTIDDLLVEATETVILTIGGIAGIGSILDNDTPASLSPLTEIVVFEAPFAKLSGAQQTAIASGGGFPAFAVSRNNVSSPAYSVYDCATIGGVYTRVLSGQSYAQSALVLGAVTLDHRTLSLDTTSEFPSSISVATYGILADTAGQYEQLLVQNIATATTAGDTVRVTSALSTGIYDSQIIAVNELDTARLYVVPTLPIVTTIVADAVDRFYKISPEDNTGTPLAIAGITPIKLTCNSIARKPYPTRLNEIATDLGFGGNFMAFRLDRVNFTPSLYFRGGKSSKPDETSPSSYFAPASVLEAGTTMNVDVMDADGFTVIRTLTADAGGIATYISADRATDIARTNTKFVSYTNKGGIKSSLFSWNLEVDVMSENKVTGVTNVKFSTTLVKSTIALTAAGAAPAGTGQETGLAFVKIDGTAFANIDIANIVVNIGGAEIIERDNVKGEFYLQFPRSTASVEIGIPYTGSVGLTVIVSAGYRDLEIGGDIFTGTATTTI